MEQGTINAIIEFLGCKLWSLDQTETIVDEKFFADLAQMVMAAAFSGGNVAHALDNAGATKSEAPRIAEDAGYEVVSIDEQAYPNPRYDRRASPLASTES